MQKRFSRWLAIVMAVSLVSVSSTAAFAGKGKEEKNRSASPATKR